MYTLLGKRGVRQAASLVPALAGAAAAAYQGTPTNVLLLLITLLAAGLVHAGVNVLNDYYDELNGTDRRNVQRVYPFTGGSRFIQNGVMSAQQMRAYGIGLLLSAVALGLLLAWVSGAALLWIGLAGLLLGWGYSAPPLHLNSRGLGEPAVAVGFGVLIPLGAWFVQAQEMALYPIVVNVPLALLLMNILVINQFPDREADAASGKHHWVVRLGAAQAVWLYLVVVVLAGLTLLLLLTYGVVPLWLALGYLPLGLTLKAWVYLWQQHQQPQTLAPAIQLTIASAVAYGCVTSLIFWVT